MNAIAASVFDDKSYAQFLEGDRTILGHKNKIHSLDVGDIVLYYNYKEKIIYGMGVLRDIEEGRIYREKLLIDPDLYTQEYAKYNKYEIGVSSFFFDTPILLHEVMKACGLPEGTPLLKGHIVSFKRITANIKPWVEKEFLKFSLKHFSK